MKALVPVSEEQAQIFTGLLREAEQCEYEGEKWPGVKVLEGLTSGV